MIDPPLVSTRPHFMVTLYECIVFMHTFDMLYKSISIYILYGCPFKREPLLSFA